MMDNNTFDSLWSEAAEHRRAACLTESYIVYGELMSFPADDAALKRARARALRMLGKSTGLSRSALLQREAVGRYFPVDVYKDIDMHIPFEVYAACAQTDDPHGYYQRALNEKLTAADINTLWKAARKATKTTVITKILSAEMCFVGNQERATDGWYDVTLHMPVRLEAPPLKELAVTVWSEDEVQPEPDAEQPAPDFAPGERAAAA